MIQISADYGEPNAERRYGSLHRCLNRVFKKYPVTSYCEAVSGFAVILRVSGKVHDFGRDGLEGVHREPDDWVVIDLVIPRDRWFRVKQQEVQHHLVDGIRSGITLMLGYLKEQGVEVKEDALHRDFESGIEEVIQEMTKEASA